MLMSTEGRAAEEGSGGRVRPASLPRAWPKDVNPGAPGVQALSRAFAHEHAHSSALGCRFAHLGICCPSSLVGLSTHSLHPSPFCLPSLRYLSSPPMLRWSQARYNQVILFIHRHRRGFLGNTVPVPLISVSCS